ncbi:RBBP9/YdeN family alpha/beta hydrolase [Flavobacterium sp. 7A]|uniref:RBBP9/YdeN family alpha/beta hydrolase n=1 Tax=Flavobacterium sp. 7A TaxID=2940571 RepID=UPI0022275F5E|nr:alpha/beta hydrolase [Flavobacterium sp. 7A]MCW2119793.1 putative alpha/beta hydrolase family esterase [Flavobacterium sp. 7A]
MQPHFLIIPGLGGSGNTHWQNLWNEKFSNSIMINQEDWENPQLEKWLEKLNSSILEIQEPTILVGHSLGAILITLWANQFQHHKIIGALLVAPADVDSPEHTPEILRHFAPIPLNKLAFPSLVITSSNDPYISTERAEIFSKNWGSTFVSIGEKGHINGASNLGLWEEGQEYLKYFIESL